MRLLSGKDARDVCKAEIYMRVIHWAWVVAFLAVSGGVHAGDIYVCKGANGVNSYQNTPCPTPAAELQHNTYDAALARPGTQPPPDGAQQPVQQREVYQAPPAGDAYVNSQRSPSAPTGYQCTASRRTWIQKTPCPATYSTSNFVDIDGHLMDGTPVRGTGFMPVDKPVQQQQLSRDALCDQVRAGARVGQGGGSSASQSYERNKLKRNLCGG
ncbi:hypothetical protein ASG75_01740 [Rhodanobacter sp. Soil772]|nr:hypothetical protein ASG75_01740 [Rhodanobacter sp. Soil772]